MALSRNWGIKYFREFYLNFLSIKWLHMREHVRTNCQMKQKRNGNELTRTTTSYNNVKRLRLFVCCDLKDTNTWNSHVREGKRRWSEPSASGTNAFMVRLGCASKVASGVLLLLYIFACKSWYSRGFNKSVVWKIMQIKLIVAFVIKKGEIKELICYRR